MGPKSNAEQNGGGRASTRGARPRSRHPTPLLTLVYVVYVDDVRIGLVRDDAAHTSSLSTWVPAICAWDAPRTSHLQPCQMSSHAELSTPSHPDSSSVSRARGTAIRGPWLHRHPTTMMNTGSPEGPTIRCVLPTYHDSLLSMCMLRADVLCAMPTTVR